MNIDPLNMLYTPPKEDMSVRQVPSGQDLRPKAKAILMYIITMVTIDSMIG